MTLREFLNDILDDNLICLKFIDGKFSTGFFYKEAVNRLSNLLDCEVHRIGSNYVRDRTVIFAYIECKDLNDIRNFFKRD